MGQKDMFESVLYRVPQRNVILNHKKFPPVQKITSCLETVQQGKPLEGTFLWDTGTFFEAPDIYRYRPQGVFIAAEVVNYFDACF